MKRYGRKTKYKNIKKHFASRCLERVGFLLDAKEITRKIQNNELPFYKRRSNNRTIFKYHDSITKREYLIVYDKMRKEPVTVMLHNRKERKAENV